MGASLVLVCIPVQDTFEYCTIYATQGVASDTPPHALTGTPPLPAPAHQLRVCVIARRAGTAAYTDRPVIPATTRKVREAGGKAHTVRLDVADEESVKAAFDVMPLPDVVINNAGINIEASTTDLAGDEWDQVMDTNVKGMWLVSREAIRLWINEQRPGNIINIASILGLRVQSQLAVYAASKAAALQLSRSLALDYARYNIRANAICPGYYVTDINRDLQPRQRNRIQSCTGSATAFVRV